MFNYSNQNFIAPGSITLSLGEGRLCKKVNIKNKYYQIATKFRNK